MSSLLRAKRLKTNNKMSDSMLGAEVTQELNEALDARSKETRNVNIGAELSWRHG